MSAEGRRLREHWNRTTSASFGTRINGRLMLLRLHTEKRGEE
jgi:hypothetical protein